MNLIDAHCHIEALENSQSLKSLCVCAYNKPDLDKLFASKVQNLKICAGIHPMYMDDFTLDELKNSISKIDIIGEIGLDKKTYTSTQLQLFKMQLELAKEHNLPVLFHNNSCWNKFLKTIRQVFGKDKWNFVLHRASCSLELAKQLRDMGVLFSFSQKNLNTRKGLELLEFLDVSEILIETDFDAESSQLEKSLSDIAKLKNIDEELLKQQIQDNFFKLFSK